MYVSLGPPCYSKLVYASSSSPLRLLFSTGSARISTPGPTRLWLGKTCSRVSLCFFLNASDQTHLCVGPAKAEGQLIGKQLAKAQHQTVDKGQEQVDGSTPHQAPEGRWGVEDQG